MLNLNCCSENSRNFSYYTGFAKHILKLSALHSLPGVAFAGIMACAQGIFKSLKPLSYYNDKMTIDLKSMRIRPINYLKIDPIDLPQDPFMNYFSTGNSLFVRRLEKGLKDLYQDQQKPIPENFQDRLKKVTYLLEKKLYLYRKKIDELNIRFGTSAQFCFDVTPKFGDSYAPFAAFGGAGPKGGEPYGHPVVLIKISGLDLWEQTKESTNQSIFESNSLPSAEEFALTHEFMHILHNDSLSMNVIKTISKVAGAAPWILGFFTPMSWGSYLAYATIRSFAVQLPSLLFQKTFSQFIEKRADIEAMECLDSNKEAMAFFDQYGSEECMETVEDYDHPPMGARIESAINWKSKKD